MSLTCPCGIVDESLRHYRDTLIVMEGQYMEGEKKGRAEGRAEEKLNNARSLKKNGVPIDLIAKSLGLTTEEIEGVIAVGA